MNKIYIYRETCDNIHCSGIAFTSEGEELAKHYSSDYSFFTYDMGLKGNTFMGNQKHEKYKIKYPNGYELIEVIGLDELKKHIPGIKIYD